MDKGLTGKGIEKWKMEGAKGLNENCADGCH